MEKYTVSDELNKRYRELEKKYGTEKMIYFCMYSLHGETEKLPADVKEYFDYEDQERLAYLKEAEKGAQDNEF